MGRVAAARNRPRAVLGAWLRGGGTASFPSPDRYRPPPRPNGCTNGHRPGPAPPPLLGGAARYRYRPRARARARSAGSSCLPPAPPPSCARGWCQAVAGLPPPAPPSPSVPSPLAPPAGTGARPAAAASSAGESGAAPWRRRVGGSRLAAGAEEGEERRDPLPARGSAPVCVWVGGGGGAGSPRPSRLRVGVVARLAAPGRRFVLAGPTPGEGGERRARPGASRGGPGGRPLPEGYRRPPWGGSRPRPAAARPGAEGSGEEAADPPGVGVWRGPAASCCRGRQVRRPRRRVLRARGDRGHRPHLRREGGARRGRGSAFTPEQRGRASGLSGEGAGASHPPGPAGLEGAAAAAAAPAVSAAGCWSLCVCVCVRVAVRG